MSDIQKRRQSRIAAIMAQPYSPCTKMYATIGGKRVVTDGHMIAISDYSEPGIRSDDAGKIQKVWDMAIAAKSKQIRPVESGWINRHMRQDIVCTLMDDGQVIQESFLRCFEGYDLHASTSASRMVTAWDGDTCVGVLMPMNVSEPSRTLSEPLTEELVFGPLACEQNGFYSLTTDQARTKAISDLQCQLKDAERELEDWQDKLNEAEEQVDELEAEISKLNRALDALMAIKLEAA